MFSLKQIKFMLSGIFMVLISIFVIVLMILLWSDTGISANATGFHSIVIFAPFITGILLFVIGLLAKAHHNP